MNEDPAAQNGDWRMRSRGGQGAGRRLVMYGCAQVVGVNLKRMGLHEGVIYDRNWQMENS